MPAPLTRRTARPRSEEIKTMVDREPGVTSAEVSVNQAIGTVAKPADRPDRILHTEAECEDLTLVTRDAEIRRHEGSSSRVR
jgi:PIN domain nuclease of toxin-antitoxin system